MPAPAPGAPVCRGPRLTPSIPGPCQITLSPGDTVIDVGANAGIFAVCAAQAAGPTGRVLALEPSPAASECARFNVKAHAEWLARQPGAPRAAPVEVLQVACGDGGAESLTLLEYDNVSVLNSVVPNYQQAHTMVRVRRHWHRFAPSGARGDRTSLAARAQPTRDVLPAPAQAAASTCKQAAGRAWSQLRHSATALQHLAHTRLAPAPITMRRA